MVAVHPLQVKEMGSQGSSSSVEIDTILVEPSSKTSSDANNKSNTFWYFAIGSMMSPKSMENRNIVPLKSAPAELFDYDLKFFGGMGFGEAVHKPGASFHGVLVSYIDYTVVCYILRGLISHFSIIFVTLYSLLVYVHSFMSTRLCPPRLSYSAPCGY